VGNEPISDREPVFYYRANVLIQAIGVGKNPSPIFMGRCGSAMSIVAEPRHFILGSTLLLFFNSALALKWSL